MTGVQTCALPICQFLWCPHSHWWRTSAALLDDRGLQQQAQSSSSTTIPPFKFRQRRESVDWRRVSAVDVDLVASELDFLTLQEHVQGVTFCSVEGERCPRCQSPVDPALLKLFRLAQLTVEYLLHSQEVLTLSLQDRKSVV